MDLASLINHLVDPDDPVTLRAQDAIARAAAGELLGPGDIQAIWRISQSQFQRLNRIHAFDQFKVHPPIGPRCFSGTLITRYLSGSPVYPESRSRRRG